jgi:hypothetical protein
MSAGNLLSKHRAGGYARTNVLCTCTAAVSCAMNKHAVAGPSYTQLYFRKVMCCSCYSWHCRWEERLHEVHAGRPVPQPADRAAGHPLQDGAALHPLREAQPPEGEHRAHCVLFAKLWFESLRRFMWLFCVFVRICSVMSPVFSRACVFLAP